MASEAASDDLLKKGLQLKEFVIDIQEVPEPAEWPECCIYRVPKKLRMVNRQAYTPKLISIGPLHHRSQELRDMVHMEMQKVRYLTAFCLRTKKSREELAFIIKENEEKIRHCYAETSKLSSKEFIKMILLDGIFILELFLRNYQKTQHTNDFILSKPWLRDGIQHDLLLLENQLPYFFLELLYNKVVFPSSSTCSNNHKEGLQIEKHKEDQNNEPISFIKLCRKYFSKYDRQPDQSITGEIRHFTDLLRSFFYPQPQTLENTGEKAIACCKNFACCCTKEDKEEVKSKKVKRHLYCATKLDEAGVKFKEVEDRQLLDIKFQKGKSLDYCPCLNCSWILNCLPCLRCFFFLERMQPFLELPTFVVDHATDCVFRNVMALEQCHYPKQAYICNYILLLDCLINTAKDVDLLVEKKVIVNQLGSDEAVARLVNKLGHQIVAEDSYYNELSKTLNEHYENFWNKNMATLTTVYFRDIWRGTATVVGIIFLLLTFWNIFLRHFVKMPHGFNRTGSN